MPNKSFAEDQVAAGVKENVRNLPILSLLVAGLAGAGAMAILSAMAGPKGS